MAHRNKAERVIVYCRSHNTVADLFAHFQYTLGNDSYHPPGAEHISDNRLFEMYHASTSPHNKEVIQKSMQDSNGVVRIVFATIALGMGVNMVDVNTTWGSIFIRRLLTREGCTGEKAKSIIFLLMHHCVEI